MSGRLDWAQWRSQLFARLEAFEQPRTAAQQEDILDARARALARSGALASASRDGEFLRFTLNAEQYAIDPGGVLGVARLQQLARVPSADAHVLGLTEWHGELLPVFRLRFLLGQSEPGLSDQRQLLVLGNERVAFGFLIDEVESIQRIAAGQIRPSERENRYTRGLTSDGILVLDAKQLLGVMAEEES